MRQTVTHPTGRVLILIGRTRKEVQAHLVDLDTLYTAPVNLPTGWKLDRIGWMGWAWVNGLRPLGRIPCLGCSSASGTALEQAQAGYVPHSAEAALQCPSQKE